MAVAKRQTRDMDGSTEEKIKEAARIVFTRNGFQATTVRDIAQEAGINFSLVNYYFRSKEKLFKLIMAEVVEQLVTEISGFLNDEKTSVEEKIKRITAFYIDLLLSNADLPLFIVNEILRGSELMPPKVVVHSFMTKQLGNLAAKQKKPVDPYHLLMNLMGMIAMPFLSKNVFIKLSVINERSFLQLMKERKKQIPHWIMQMTRI